MKKLICLATVCVMAAVNVAFADTFGSGVNAFNIDFVTISGSTNPTSGIFAGPLFVFTGVAKDYRMGTYEITNDQWNKFKTAYNGAVAGTPTNAYDQAPAFSTDAPTNNVSWYEAAQLVGTLVPEK